MFSTFKMITIVLLVLAIHGTTYKENYVREEKVMGYKKTWIWETKKICENTDKYLEFLKKENCRELFLNIDEELDIEVYKCFIEKLNNNGIRVNALGGDSSWIVNEEEYNNFFKWLRKYQDKVGKKYWFDGIHLNLESDVKENLNLENNKDVEELQNYIIKAVQESKNMKLKIDFDIPYCYDEIIFKNKFGEDNLINWIFKNTDYITIMTNRKDIDKIIESVEDEFVYGNELEKKISIAVETEKADQKSQNSFYGEKKKLLDTQIDYINDIFKINNSYNGVGISEIESWMNIEE